MSYQKVTGTLTANSHPGSYCGQDAYNNMLVTEKRDEDIFVSRIRALQGISTGIQSKTKGLQGCHGSDFEGGGATWILRLGV